MKEKVVVIGAGLCGTLLAIRLAQRGYSVDLYERRPDMRRADVPAGRSINLALSDRGIKALSLVGMQDFAKEAVIPMYGRMIHPLEGEAWLSPYSGRKDDYINSVSRGGLNEALLNEADRYEDVQVHFDMGCSQVDLDNGKVAFKNAQDGSETWVEASAFFAADGAGSVVRRSVLQRSASLQFQYEQKWLHHGYKELSIPASETGAWRIEKNALHIWPRGSYMMIALPNLDGSFTGTLFHPFKGENGLETLDTKPKVKDYFDRVYTDAVPHLLDLEEEYFENPTSPLGMIKCYPWQVNGKFLLIGDSAHAIVPFYGQGMNCAFEDVVVLDQYMAEFGNDWERVFKAYQQDRKADTDAICDLAIDNFYEMRDHVDDEAFMRKRKLETRMEQELPDYFSKYSLVTFQEELPYAAAMQQGRKQDEILLDLCKDPAVMAWPLEKVQAYVRSRVHA
ncbi:MAG: NAD(P)/FAD-dependent oxidoreductase [Bacteroidota bacterium]